MGSCVLLIGARSAVTQDFENDSGYLVPLFDRMCVRPVVPDAPHYEKALWNFWKGKQLLRKAAQKNACLAIASNEPRQNVLWGADDAGETAASGVKNELVIPHT